VKPKMAMKKAGMGNAGRYVFLLGLAVSLVAGIVAALRGLDTTYAAWISLILAVLGVIVGFLNITPSERHNFLIATIALSMIGLVGFAPLQLQSVNVGVYLTSILGYIVTFVAPAAAIAAIYEIYDLGQG